MTIRFDVDAHIGAPPERVFHALTDLEHADAWMPGLVRIERLDDGPLRKGSVWRETRKMFGKEATEQFEVAALEPPRRLALLMDGTRGSSKRGEYRFLYQIEPEGDGTHVLLQAEVDGLSRLWRMMGRVMVGMFRKGCAKDFEALRDHLEQGDDASPAG